MRATILPLALLATVPLAAQSNAERIANDRYSRSHDYDLVHQRIELKGFDWDRTAFDGRVTLTLRALRPGFDSVVVDAGKLLQIRSVTDARGMALRHAEHGDTLVVYLARPRAFGDSTSLTVEYRGIVENGHGLTFIEADSGPPRRPRQLWSQGEDMNNHLWFPTYDFPNDKTTWEVIATVPAGFTAVSNGRLALDRRNPDGSRTMAWKQDQPTATYLVSLIVAPLVRISDRWRGIPVDYYVYREDSTLARPLFRVTPDMIEVFSRLTGVPYPWPKYAQTTVADFFGGMENVSATTLVDWLPDARAYADRPWYQYILIPHELAHQWFGDYVTTANWANMWLNEGFAEFMPGQYWAVKAGRFAEDDYYLDEYRQFLNIDRRKRMPLAAQGSNNIYPKGALVLEMLKKYLGEERFWASVKYYLTAHALGVAVTDDFRQAVLAATGESLEWFWDQWLYQAGYPEFTVRASYDSTARKLTLLVQQTQIDSATADSTGLRYATPEVFRMPVTIRVRTSGGEVTRRTWIEARESAVEIDSLAGEPVMVIFDEGNTILKRLTFDQPTGWLATQLEADPDLWNRNWVIGQLESRKADPAAGQALARAAGHANYFLTRARAAAALEGFPADLAVPPLKAASHDTSAQVREAAIRTLGGFREVPTGLLRDAWSQDPSYQVRAAALAALVRADPAARRELLARALTTPSYQNVIADAALAAIVEAGDTSLLEEVDRAMGEQDNPAFALAVLASRGNAHALDLLAGHLEDPRATVRRRTLQAFEFGMRPEVALARLRDVRQALTSAPVKHAVDALIDRLEKPGASEGQ